MAASISDIRLLLRVKVLPKAPDAQRVFVTGGTGYVGNNLIPVLVERGHRVRVLVRPGSKGQVPADCEVVSGNALDATTYRQLIQPCDTFIHLVGTPHPSPSEAAEFRAVDLVAGRRIARARHVRNGCTGDPLGAAGFGPRKKPPNHVKTPVQSLFLT